MASLVSANQMLLVTGLFFSRALCFGTIPVEITKWVSFPKGLLHCSIPSSCLFFFLAEFDVWPPDQGARVLRLEYIRPANRARRGSNTYKSSGSYFLLSWHDLNL